MLLVEGPRMYQRSTALIRVVARLPFPWRLAAVVWLVPSPIRDWLYDRVALNRYRIFGRFESCVVPTADHLERYLGGD
jgi:predicted DCC family thiol-disulfide oxidoreductase YuxK